MNELRISQETIFSSFLFVLKKRDIVVSGLVKLQKLRYFGTTMAVIDD